MGIISSSDGSEPLIAKSEHLFSFGKDNDKDCYCTNNKSGYHINLFVNEDIILWAMTVHHFFCFFNNSISDNTWLISPFTSLISVTASGIWRL